jgi:hypothetical protein
MLLRRLFSARGQKTDSHLAMGIAFVYKWCMESSEPRLIHLKKLGKMDLGFVTVGEYQKHIPFDIKRAFWIYGVPEHVKRGEHSHRELSQVLFALSGEVRVSLEDLSGKKMSFVLDDPSIGLFLPKLHWGGIVFKQGSVMLSLCSLAYDEAEYIRSYDEFKNIQKSISTRALAEF